MFLDPDSSRPSRRRSTSCARKVFGVGTIKGGIKGDINRLKSVGEAKYQARRAKGKAGELAADRPRRRPRQARNGQKKAAKMGLFSKKKKCPSCGREAARELGPVPVLRLVGGAARAGSGCGSSARAEPAPKMRTMAIDARGGGGAGAGARVSAGWCRSTGRRPASCSSSRAASSSARRPTATWCMKEPSISGRHAEFIADRPGLPRQRSRLDQRHLRQRQARDQQRSHRQRQRPARSRQLQVQVDELSAHAPACTVLVRARYSARSAGRAPAPRRRQAAPRAHGPQSVADAQALPHLRRRRRARHHRARPRTTSRSSSTRPSRGAADRAADLRRDQASRSTSSSWPRSGRRCSRGDRGRRSAPSRARRLAGAESRRWRCSATPPTPSG